MLYKFRPKDYQMKELSLESQKLALLPLKNVVILPKSIIPSNSRDRSSVEAVEYSIRNNKPIFITAQRAPIQKILDKMTFLLTEQNLTYYKLCVCQRAP